MRPRNPAWWKDPQRRQLLRAMLEESQREAAATGTRLTWKETAVGFKLYVNGRYDSTITLAELRAGEQAWMERAAEHPESDDATLIRDASRRVLGEAADEREAREGGRDAAE